MLKVRCWLFNTFLAASFACNAQDANLFSTHPDSLNSKNLTSVFHLIDSLLQLDFNPGSQLIIRLGYNSNVLSAGRTLGIENFGLAPGLSYYHKTGFYADISSYWSKDFDPSYYLTITSAGYMHDFTKKISVMVGYDRYFYNTLDTDTYIPFKNALSCTPSIEFKPIVVSANYSYYFGDKRVHRIMPGINIILQKKHWLGLDRIIASPSFYTLFGNETFTEVLYPETVVELIKRQRQGLPIYEQVNINVFGVMNYAFSLPLRAHYKSFSLIFTYTYNIPKALPGEPLAISNSHYLSGSLNYSIDLKRK